MTFTAIFSTSSINEPQICNDYEQFATIGRFLSFSSHTYIFILTTSMSMHLRRNLILPFSNKIEISNTFAKGINHLPNTMGSLIV